MKLRTLLFLAAAGLLLAGCGGKEPEVCYAAPDLGITMTAENVTPSGMTLVIAQQGGEVTGELNTGSWYRVESMDGKEPDCIVDGEVGWDSAAWLVPMGDSIRWEVDWAWLYGELPPGGYRICKEFLDLREPGDYDRTLCFAEFTVR